MAEVPGTRAPPDAQYASLRRRIRSAFFLQIAAIGMATVLGVYGAYFVLEDVLVRRALTDEAAYYVDRLRLDPAAPLPNMYNVRGYLQPPRPGDPPMPVDLARLEPGYGIVSMNGRNDIVHISQTPAGRLYLVFAQQQLNRLALFFGFVPLSIVLVAIYLIVWMTYRASKRAVSPVIWLANHVRAWDPKHPDLRDLSPDRLPPDAEGEVEVLASAMRSFAERNQAFMARERNFTRDASHELRSPLTVIKIASDVLLAEGGLTPFAVKNIERIRHSARGMEALIESFLILARESDTGLPIEDFLANEIVLEEVDNARPMLVGKPVNLRCEQRAQLSLHAPPRVLIVVMGNLIRNACQYTERGEIVIVIEQDRIEVRDTGVGVHPNEIRHVFEPFFRSETTGGRSGHGIGLTIVKRLVDRFGWRITLDSRQDIGTTVTIAFPVQHALAA